MPLGKVRRWGYMVDFVLAVGDGEEEVVALLGIESAMVGVVEKDLVH